MAEPKNRQEAQGGSAGGGAGGAQQQQQQRPTPGQDAPGAAPEGQATGPTVGATTPGGTHQADEGGQGIRPTFVPGSGPGQAGATASVYHESALEAMRRGQEWQPPSPEQLAQEAEQREKERARTRGVSEEELETLAESTVWVVSNRLDERVVPGSFERDPRHPGGECSGVANDTPARVFLTPLMERLRLNGELVVLPEGHEPIAFVEVQGDDGNKRTIRNRRLPVDVELDLVGLNAAQPGAPTPIGRELSPALFSEETRKAVKRMQRTMPAQIPVPPGGHRPTLQEVDRPA